MLRFFCLLFLLLGPGAQAGSCDPALAQQMASLSAMVQSDPVATANSAIASRHYGFLGVAGYALSLPGAENSGADPARNRRCGLRQTAPRVDCAGHPLRRNL